MTTNHGLLLESIRPDTGFFGGVAGEAPDLLPIGDWTDYLPDFEQQAKLGLETMNCVQFSRLNVCETQARYYGKPLNLSDRFLYWASGCTERGNTFGACDYGFRMKGGCAETLWPWIEPLTRLQYGEKPPEEIQLEAEKLLADWEIGLLIYVPNDIDSMKRALSKGSLWFCNDVHAMMIYKIDDRIRVFDTYGTGKGSFPLDYVSEIVRIYLAPFTPKNLAPQPMVKLPPNCLVAIVDGHGDRLMNVDGTKLYEDEAGKIDLELMARNAKIDPATGLTMAHGFPVVHLKTSDIAGIPRVNLKGEPV